jgi:transcriptional regulator with XRE-family HTH domain
MNDIKFNGNKLFKMRKERGISQEKLAELVGVSRQTIYLWESNQNLPDIEKVGKICEILNIEISDLVDGITLKNDSSNPKEKSLNKKSLLKLIVIILVFLICIYVVISTIKFIRLNNILNKWKELDNTDNYYIKIEEFENDENENMSNGLLYESYFKDGILKIVFRDENNDISSIVIFDYNNDKKIMINEYEKTYSEENLVKTEENIKLSSHLPNILSFNKNAFLNYIWCFNPKFSISDKGIYILKIKNYLQENINKENGLIEYEEVLDSKVKKIKRYYEIKLNNVTDEDVKIPDVSEYTLIK